MIPTYLLPLANHLWQSSLFTAAAGSIALTLRRHRASLRYGLWLAASVKFLIPFSLLIQLGSQFIWRAAPPIARPEIPSWIGGIGQPFPLPDPAPLLAAVPQAPSPLPTVLFAVWLAGLLLSAFWWLRSWLHLRAALSAASPMRTDFPAGHPTIPVMQTHAPIEPCVFGIFRPVLLLPKGIRNRLTPHQLQTILLHELCHVRRRDNLAAAIHMLVETLFWFNPLVHWIGNRLMDERELACDEEVLRLTRSPEVYAQGILAVCRLCLRTSPVCAGVTGSNLKHRIEGIMQYRTALQLDFRRKVLLVLTVIAALAGPLAIGVFDAKTGRAQSEPAIRLSFEVASIKPALDDGGTGPRNFRRSYSPQGIDFRGLTLGFIISEAYQFPPGRIVGPNSLTKQALWGSLTQGYDITARSAGAVPRDQLRLMLQSLLADRFQLKLHRESKPGPVYRLVVAKGGPKLEESDGGDLAMSGSADGFVFRNAELFRLAGYLSGQVDRMVVDETGLKGPYTFTLKIPEDLRQNPTVKSEAGSNAAAVFADVLKPLGLQLVAATAPVEYLIVDRVERPSPN